MSDTVQNFILFLASIRPGCGNTSTARRIVNHLMNSSRYIVDCVSVEDSADHRRKSLESIEKYKVVFALHAYRAGRVLVEFYETQQKCLPPLIIIFAGTDLHSCEQNWISTFEKILPRTSAFVCFSQSWKIYVERVYGNLITSPIYVIPQSVSIQSNVISDNHLLDSIKQKNIILWIGEIRTVKDPLFALKIISLLEIADYHLLIVGSELDSTLADQVRSISSQVNVTLLGVQSHDIVQSLMKNAFVYLNTSINEGMSLTILEAMNFGLPVVVRSNTGNNSIVQQQRTGFIFNTVEEAVQQLKQLDSDKDLRNTFIRQATDYIRIVHHPADEQRAYSQLLESFSNR